ncbi:MAG: DUF58 domain-containing protein [Pseudomonadales bacterium]
MGEPIAQRGAYPALDGLLALQHVARGLALGTTLRKSRSSGHLQTSVRGRGLEFAEVRQYQPGDDIRSIDWRVTAKTQKTHTRLFTQERERPVILAADMRSNMFFGSQRCFKSVLCAEALSVLAWTAHSAGDKVGAVVMGDRDHLELKPSASKRALLGTFQALVDFAAKLDAPVAPETGHIQQLFARLLRVARPGSAVFIVSDFYDFDSECDKYLTQLSRHCEVTLVHVSDALEWQLTGGGAQWLSDGEHTQLVRSQQVEQQMQRRYSQLLQRCSRSSVELLALQTAQDVAQPLGARYAAQHKSLWRRA